MRNAFLILLTAAALSLTACRNEPTVPDDAGASATSGSDAATTDRSGSGGAITETEIERRERELLSQLVVYFDYDQADIRPEFNALLTAHGRRLAQNPNMQVRLEGHTDERGSREYNIGLGDRRATAVRRVLTLQGAAATQLTTVSYGEERPAQTGSDEEAWRLNRRVELVYR